jgi:lipoprotein-anchoring transpeptidase ErfK/SrfK
VNRRRSRSRITLLVTMALAVAGIVSSAASVAYAADAPGAPTWVSPPDGYAANSTAVTLVAGSATTSVTVLFNGASLGVQECTTGVTLSFGRVSMPAGVSSFVAVASNGAETRDYEYRVRRLDYPWATCIIIDKSDYRLYWVQGDELVQSYRIAIGKRRTPTPNAVWKVGRKDKASPRGVYGPRRLRLYRRITYRTRSGRTGWRYRYSSYLIHGTNQPWVIGTMASHGCIRLTNAQIMDLWPRVPLGTMVLTRQ